MLSSIPLFYRALQTISRQRYRLPVRRYIFELFEVQFNAETINALKAYGKMMRVQPMNMRRDKSERPLTMIRTIQKADEYEVWLILNFRLNMLTHYNRRLYWTLTKVTSRQIIWKKRSRQVCTWNLFRSMSVSMPDYWDLVVFLCCYPCFSDQFIRSTLLFMPTCIFNHLYWYWYLVVSSSAFYVINHCIFRIPRRFELRGYAD